MIEPCTHIPNEDWKCLNCKKWNVGAAKKCVKCEKRNPKVWNYKSNWKYCEKCDRIIWY